MPESDPSFLQKYQQALVTAAVLILLFLLVYYLLPADMVSFIYKDYAAG